MCLRLPLPGSSAVVQTCNALLQNVLPPGTQDPNLNYIYVKRVTDAAGTQQVSMGNTFFETLCAENKRIGNPVGTVRSVHQPDMRSSPLFSEGRYVPLYRCISDALVLSPRLLSSVAFSLACILGICRYFFLNSAHCCSN